MHKGCYCGSTGTVAVIVMGLSSTATTQQSQVAWVQGRAAPPLPGAPPPCLP